MSQLKTIKSILFINLFIISFYGCSTNKDSSLLKKPACINYSKAPFSGTIFIDPDIITPDDPTTFVSLSYQGRAQRTMYDRRVADWITISPYLFPAIFDDSIVIEIQVNPEFGTADDAKIQAEKFAPIIGRLTTELRKDVETVWIHKGVKPFGGGNNNLLIHTDYSSLYYEQQGILEETFVHEAAHTSLDAYHAINSDWTQAQEDDCRFISDYAQEHPTREDIAESYLPYFAVRYRSERITPELRDSIESAIPNRIKYFDAQNFNMYPLER